MRKLIVIAALIFTTPLWASKAENLLKQHLNSIQTMRADFSQTVKAGRRAVSSSSGEMALSRPGRFRWQTDEPMRQLVVADGKSLWIYDVELEQVTVKKQNKGLGGTPALFLSGYDDSVARDFEVGMQQKGARLRFELRAKSSRLNFQKVTLIFNKETLTTLELDDQLNQHTVVQFKQVKTNPRLPEKMFEFKPPRGVDVVRQ